MRFERLKKALWALILKKKYIFAASKERRLKDKSKKKVNLIENCASRSQHRRRAKHLKSTN